MKLFNTLTQKTEPLVVRDGKLSIYVCGITPYDTTHLGHAFTYASYDQLIRYLEMRGVNVRYAQNVTDIDDDILKRSRETGQNWRELGQRWTNHFIDDMIALNMRPPDFYPRATGVIQEIIAAVDALIQAGVAYQAGGSVYYAVNRFPNFGRLSHLPVENMLDLANERGNYPDDPNKLDPLDFVLWQAQSPGEPAWPSPWGLGRPGWHIECSTMATQYLGETIDVHGGGADLCFPHHECEIAQVQPVRSGQPYVRIWMHTAMVGYQGEKMSKSLGNLVMVSDLLKQWSADALRLYLGSHHYRENWSFNAQDLPRFEALAGRLRDASALPIGSGGGSGLLLTAIESAFSQAMEDDLNTPAALRVVENLAGDLLINPPVGHDLQQAQDLLRRLGQVIGLTFGAPDAEAQVSRHWNRHRQPTP